MDDTVLIDTHCHFNHERFDEDFPEAMERAIVAGVSRMIVVGFDLDSSRRAVELAATHVPLYAAVGIHPHDAKNWNPDAESEIRHLAMHSKTVAIGEIGLDFHYNFSSMEEQFSAFEAQLMLSSELGLPFIIHCREAYVETLDILEQRPKGLNGVMHCWAGTPDQAERALSAELWLGIGGVVTFKNAEDLREAVRRAPMERLVLETDAPYLAPVPHRGKRNEPAYTSLVAEAVADLRGVSVEKVADATTITAERLFPKIGN